MNGVVPALSAAELAVLGALPIGIAVFDAARRVVVMNPAYCASLALPPGAIAPGTTLEEAIRQAAYRGVFGPGDPETQIREQMRADRSRSRRLRRRSFGGRTYDLHSSPLAGGGYVVCAVETTAMIAARTEAEASATQLSGAIATMRIGIAVFGADTNLRLHNARFAELLGLPAERIARGMSLKALGALMQGLDEYAGSEGEAFLAGRRALDRRVPSAERWVRPNGQVIDIVTDPLPDGGSTVTVADVSALARAEDESRRRAGMLNGLLDAIPHGICVYGPDRRVTMLNPAYAAVMRGAPVAIGDTLEAVIRRRAEAGEYGAGPAPSHIAAELSHDIARPQVRRRARPNGMTIDVRTAPLPDGGHVTVVTDVSSLVQAEVGQAQRAAEMEAMLANIRHGIILWSADKRLIAFNRIAAELSGAPGVMPEAGQHYDEHVRQQLAAGLFGAGASAEDYARHLIAHDRREPLRTYRRQEPDRELEVRSEPTPDGGFVTAISDISESRHTETELRLAKEAAETAATSKARFLTTMSHELRTPLNAVIGFSDAILRDRGGTDPVVVREYAEEINGAGKRLLLLINTILDVSRIDAGRYDLGTDRIDFARLVQLVLRQSRNAATAAEIDLHDALPAAMPMVRGDERRMQQVLGHLISNAVKFSEPGGHATISAEHTGNGDLLVRVSDTGIGIAEENLDRVFEPFTQLDAGLERQFAGTGLGLYLSRALVEAHGGTLSLRSRLGEGTVAEIRLPARRVIAAEPTRLAGD